MKKIVLYSHAGSGNHGCEAIVRSTANILGKDLKLYSMNPNQDLKYNLHKLLTQIEEDKDLVVPKYSVHWFLAKIQTKLTSSILREISNRKKSMIEAVNVGDVWMSIGGDNYCYPGTDLLAAENQLLKQRGAKTVLWGCSVEPELLGQKQIANDLAKYDLITARESISYQALKKINDNTLLVADPAFTLQRVDLPTPEQWVDEKMVGINASPLILKNAKDSELIFYAYQDLIEYILEETDLSIALIPHVVWDSNDDRTVLKKLYNQFKTSNRICLIEDCNCMELKGYIARCRMFIGARTHATIAAYSSCVPTLVLGYSVKSRGIAKDLFGEEKNYVISVQQVRERKVLVEAFEWLSQNEETIREHLKNIMPEYIGKAFIARNVVEKL